jgi:hypothetical protein
MAFFLVQRKSPQPCQIATTANDQFVSDRDKATKLQTEITLSIQILPMISPIHSPSLTVDSVRCFSNMKRVALRDMSQPHLQTRKF